MTTIYLKGMREVLCYHSQLCVSSNPMRRGSDRTSLQVSLNSWGASEWSQPLIYPMPAQSRCRRLRHSPLSHFSLRLAATNASIVHIPPFPRFSARARALAEASRCDSLISVRQAYRARARLLSVWRRPHAGSEAYSQLNLPCASSPGFSPGWNRRERMSQTSVPYSSIALQSPRPG